MGEQNVIFPKRKKQIQDFVKHVLSDTRALEKMLHENLFETDTIRIGAEQEFNLIDKSYKPFSKNLEVLDHINNDAFTTELARFNLECNLPPLEFKGNCLSKMEQITLDLLEIARNAAHDFDADIIMMGILPTIRKFDVDMSNITPIPRYRALMESILKLRGEHTKFNILGIEELIVSHDSPLMEACNTGFQVHLQVTPDDFVQKYNYANAIAGPALAVGVGSPILFGRRLWKETRIALFQQSVDTRKTANHLRRRSPRVMFGTDWVKKSLLEIYKEDIMRFRVLLTTPENIDSLKVLEEGKIPNLMALQVHNSTVYRWNRPCYGVANGVPHLRIENRVLPAGPTVQDEMANAALWLGLLEGLPAHYPDITKVMDFDHAKSNFIKACRNGLDTAFYWVDGKIHNSQDLLINELIPIAQEGLEKRKVDEKDIKKYMTILRERVATRRTTSRWMLDSFSKLTKQISNEQAIAAITASTLENQRMETPIHTWDLADVKDLDGWKPASLSIEEFMTTDLFTVRKDDIIQLVAEMMDSRKLRYIMVENEAGELVGMITSRQLLRHYLSRHLVKSKRIIAAVDLMIPLKALITISPEETISTAIELMEKHDIGCLPVVKAKQLVGVIIEHDFLKISRRLLKGRKDQ